MSFIRQIGVSLPYSPAIDLPYSPAIEKSLRCHTQMDCDQNTKNSHVDTAPLEQQNTWLEIKILSHTPERLSLGGCVFNAGKSYMLQGARIILESLNNFSSSSSLPPPSFSLWMFSLHSDAKTIARTFIPLKHCFNCLCLDTLFAVDNGICLRRRFSME